MSELERAQAEIQALRDQLAVMQQQMDWLKKQLFGRKSERGLPEGQDELGLELAEEGEKEVPPPPAKETSSSRTGKKRETRAQRLPDHLPVREEVIVPLAVQAEPEAWRQIGEEVTETLEKEPGYLYVRRLIRPKFVKIERPHQPPVVAPAPPALIPGGFYGPGLLADLVLDKYLDHLPLYRIEQRFWRIHGVKVPRQSMSDALAQIAELATPIVRAMEQTLWAGGYIQADETPVRCLDPTRPGGSYRGWMWTITGPPGSDVIFRWAQSRGHEVFKNWLPVDFRGVVQRDGYSAYAAVASQRGADVIWAGCWAHVRRKFFEAAQAGDRTAKWFVGQIGLLYAVERTARERSFSPKLRQRERAVASSMVLARLHRAFLRLAGKLRPKSLLGQAITYALGQWPVLQVFRERGEIEIDNNRVENAIRPTAIGKKNCLRPCRMRLRRRCHAAFAAGRWLFIGATEAGSKSAVLYSLIGSCLQRALNPRQYLLWLFSRLPTATNQTVAELTPAAFAKLKVGATTGPRPVLAA